MLILYALFLHTNTSTGVVSDLKGNPVKFRSGPAAVILIPSYVGVSAFAANMPLFISEWEGW